jgi:uncharacterized protein YjbI with pentapeptide repeats
LFIAERNRQKDEFLADDQQKETILIDYENFLVQFLLTQEILSTRNTPGRLALRMKTLAALGQLIPSRRTFLLRSLYEAELINCNISMDRSCESTINLALADLTGLALGLLSDNDVEVDDDNKRVCSYLMLEQTILRNASFRGVNLSGSVFTRVKLDHADFSFSSVRQGESITFERAKLAEVTFNSVRWYSAIFNRSNLTLAIFRQFESYTSLFHEALLHGTVFESTTLLSSIFTGAVLRNVCFLNTQLFGSDWSDSESIDACYFIRSNLTRAIFVGSSIRNTSFSDGHLLEANLSRTRISEVRFNAMNMIKIDFIGAVLDRCHFDRVHMTYCYLSGASLHGTTWLNTDLSNCTGLTSEQIRQTHWMNSTVLPNGTLYTGSHR